MVHRRDAIVIGAGAAGMMCALTAGRRGRHVAVLDHAAAPGEKIRISGGGRCNFTNVHAGPKNYLSANPHFAKSALARFRPADFIAMVEAHGIAWHEKTLGQLFCDGSARDIIAMFLKELAAVGATLHLKQSVVSVERTDGLFRVRTETDLFEAPALVVASGGKSIPKMGATGLAYRIAGQFGLAVLETRPGLVPLTLDPAFLEKIAPLAGVSVDAEVRHGRTAFREALLFTHRGLSGPAILQISSYWREGDEIAIRIAPDVDFAEVLNAARRENGRQSVATALAAVLPKRLAQFFAAETGAERPLAELSGKAQAALVARLGDWRIRPAGSEGYRTAEVTLGGVDTAGLDSRDMQAKAVPGLYFIGECVDVTGWLGGYNFQWAWASGHAAGEAV
ncbi:NAD(P)/FAD-dependent oxidoreductase [Rhizobiaceae bacterium BDR2-2]|uniref:NAD(P)/FAD-dependent oxidoreductase n=1 Tax=Ectorhizobium quercum TaxID=2965071 RepID=A0AAE3MXM4_9HYPH|nr:NAD(P)/FAD-dependent oxidoreductase [Ectorhizobium quercum]MCX8996151.1 NAD(P)/FAD-dependent oxidoreductase [Ectorhizobium quercum]MCX8998810.1 NAD(P)/FAD-dependent oxidoreductase [Ectorhizobium quercum]